MPSIASSLGVDGTPISATILSYHSSIGSGLMASPRTRPSDVPYRQLHARHHPLAMLRTMPLPAQVLRIARKRSHGLLAYHGATGYRGRRWPLPVALELRRFH